jgi:hypothetical protein
MKRALRFAVRVLVLAAVISGISIFGSLSPKSTRPYLSALADLGAGQALAAPGCNFKACAKGPGGGPSCKSSGSPYNCRNVAGGCQLSPC